MHMYEELYIQTEYDGKDLMSVIEILYVDEDGEKQVCKVATEACIDVSTCADQGTDTWDWIRKQVELRLKNKVTYTHLYFEDDRGDGH